MINLKGEVTLFTGWNIWYNEHYMSKSVSHAHSEFFQLYRDYQTLMGKVSPGSTVNSLGSQQCLNNCHITVHYMSKSVSHAVSTLNLYHLSGRWTLGWYRVLWLIRHVIQTLTYNIQYFSVGKFLLIIIYIKVIHHGNEITKMDNIITLKLKLKCIRVDTACDTDFDM
jgi:hypothetical protein